MYKRHTEFCPASYRILDTMQAAMWSCRGRSPQPKNYKLGTLMEYFGLPFDGAHDALADVRAAAAIARVICSGREVAA